MCSFELLIMEGNGDYSSTVVKVLCYKSDGRRFIPAGVIGIFR